MVLEATVSHSFPVAAERVYDAWLDPLLIGQWMFGPKVRDEQVVSIEIDPKVGGQFSFLVNRQNTVIDHVGRYLILDRPRRLEFEWGVKGMSDNSRVIVDIEPNSSGCKVNLTHELHPDWAEYYDRAREGWLMMLGILSELLAKESPAL
ncbi:MAG: SRPBCC domain-containing protein [Deltaproteobacteria bacterium]|nr:SRPBCC domain-containing protein [Deltaproteobacteria bacterium]